jgi:hypothetical protein
MKVIELSFLQKLSQMLGRDLVKANCLTIAVKMSAGRATVKFGEQLHKFGRMPGFLCF